jgi:hypothetical protein
LAFLSHVDRIILIARILAGANWNTITIPSRGSATFNQRAWEPKATKRLR